MKLRLIRIAAILIFAVSFALPAIHTSAPVQGSDSVPGWFCAFFASYVGPSALIKSHGSGITRDSALAIVSGLVNPLFLILLLLSCWRKLVRTRLIVGALLVPCFAATWMFFSSSKTAPLLGCYLWVAGAILFVVPDIGLIFTRPTPTATIVSESPTSESAGGAVTTGQ